MTIIKGTIEFQIAEGELYMAGYDEDGGQVIVFDRWIEAQVTAGGEVKATYAHFLTLKGVVENHEGFPCPNFNQLHEAEALMARMEARGSIDTRYWKKVEARIPLEQRWKEEAYYEGMVAAGHGNLVPQAYEHLTR